jgi:hypothetical protein
MNPEPTAADRLMRKSVARRMALYLMISVSGLAAFSLLFVISIHFGIDVPYRWVLMVMFAGTLEFLIISTYRELWTRALFWLFCVFVLVIHLAIFIPILQFYVAFRPIWWIPIMLVEVLGFGLVCDALLIWPKRSNRGSR